MSENTIFDRILAKEIPADVVYEDDWVLAFRDVSPQAPTHVLVIPKTKVTGFNDLQDLPPVEVGEYVKRIAKVASKLNLDDNGYRIVFNVGSDGQQSVPYIHAHVIGGRQLSWPPG